MARLKADNKGTLDQLIDGLPEPAEALEFRPQILEEDFSAYADRVLDEFAQFAEKQPGWEKTPNNYEGIHITTPDGWILMRKSLHDPQIPINVESDAPGGASNLKETLLLFLSRFEGLRLPPKP